MGTRSSALPACSACRPRCFGRDNEEGSFCLVEGRYLMVIRFGTSHFCEYDLLRRYKISEDEISIKTFLQSSS